MRLLALLEITQIYVELIPVNFILKLLEEVQSRVQSLWSLLAEAADWQVPLTLTVEGAPTASTEVSEAAKIGDVTVTANKQGA